MNKFFIYCRKSQDREDRQLLSNTSQEKELKRFAAKKGLEVVDCLREERSAKKPGRPVFNAMIKKLENGEADGIICWKLDRLSRNSLDGGRLIWNIDNGTIKEIVTPTRTFNNNGDDKFWMSIEFGMAKKFVDDLSDNTKRGIRATLAEGRWPGWAPLGYLNVDKHGKIAGKGYDPHKQHLLGDLNRPLQRIEIDPIAGPLVRRFFQEHSKGKHSLRSICQKADSWGLRGKTGKRIGKAEAHRILTNPFYYGIMVIKGQEYEGKYEPLTSKQLFDQVQKILSDRSKPIKTRWKHAYKGLIKCANCGCAITATTKVKHYKRTNRTASYTYYHCTKRRGSCDQPWITKKKMETQIAEKIKAVVIDDEIWQLCKELLKRSYGQQIEAQVRLKESWQQDLNRTERKLKNLLDLRVNEEITEKEYGEKKKELMDKKVSLKERVEDGDLATSNWLELAENFFKSANLAYSTFKSGDLEKKRDIVRSLGWNLLLDDGNLLWDYKKPFDVLLEGHKTQNWLWGRDSNSQPSGYT